MIARYGSLAAAVSASAATVRRLPGVSETVIARLLALRAAVRTVARARAERGVRIGSERAVIAYLTATMAHEPVEQFRTLFLGPNNDLLADELVHVGTADMVQVPTRTIVAQAIANGASAIILAHNHPSGMSKPSSADLTVTRMISQCCRGLDLTVHDHVIVTRNGHFSMRRAGLL